MLSNGSYDRNYGSAPTGNYPRFFQATVEDPVASQNAGRKICRDEERVEIIMPGNPHTRPVQRVTDEHRERWPKEYAAFQQKIEISPDGTPIEEWGILQPSQREELKYLGFKTVEQIRDMNDHAIQRIGMGGRMLKEAAIVFLDDAQRVATTARLAAENERKDEQIAMLQRQITEMGQLVEQRFSEAQAMRNAPSAIATNIPGAHDPMEASRQAQAQDVASSSLDNLGSRRSRRQQQPKSEDAPLV